MIQKFSMRIATQSDAVGIATMYLASRKEYIFFAPLVHSDEEIHRWVRDCLIPTSQVWVVEQNGAIIGMMAVTERQGFNWIDQLYILPKLTRLGIGSLLIKKAKSLKLPIRLRTFQENQGARQFYEQHEFKILELTDGSGNEEHCPDMLYEWRV